MIKQVSKLKFIFLIFLIFLISYVVQMNFVITLFLLSLYAYLAFRNLKARNYNLLDLIFLFLIAFAGSFFLIRARLPFYLQPFSVVPMLTMLLFNNLEITLLITLATAFSVASFSGSPLQLAILFLISGLFSSIVVAGSHRRTTIIRAGIIVGILQALSVIFMERFNISLPERYLFFLLNGIVSSGIVLLFLPFFEYLFETVTNISLLELADSQRPLLKRLILEAPGTYHHSLVVGNLSETASEAVGANALLARVGAYYHDIGKLQKPHYFSENQEAESRHDALSPAMSKLIIMNHVKEGVEFAKKYKLNPPLIDFILQHHGNSLVYYFYRRALETLEDDHEIKEEGFRYPGPKPNTKETAIVLLADSVEAATRALKDPSPSKVEEVVHKIINNKFIDGQLDECDLTLKDLEKISVVFIRLLNGIYHSRVTYPEELRSENNHKKFPKENSYQSEKDKSNNS